jgi:hypothetical protein
MKQIEYDCPECGVTTVIEIGVRSCQGCGKRLRLIQVGEDRFVDRKTTRTIAKPPRNEGAVSFCVTPTQCRFLLRRT